MHVIVQAGLSINGHLGASPILRCCTSCCCWCLFNLRPHTLPCCACIPPQEFLAEIDLLVALSTCPQGDVSVACGTGKAPQCYPLGVQIYQPSPEALAGWAPSEPVKYTGGHGMQAKEQ